MKKILIACMFYCSFEGIQARPSGSLDQLEKDLGKPIHSFVHLVDLMPTAHWVYTTKLSKILLVGEYPIFENCRCLPVIGSTIVPLISSTFDSRFEEFVENVESVSQQKLQEAIQDTLLLTGKSSKACAMSTLLPCLEGALQNKIDLIQDQIKSDFTYDQGSIHSMKESFAWLGLIAAVLATNDYIESDDNNSYIQNSLNFLLVGLVVLRLLPASYKMLKSSYGVLTKNPNACNQYLKKYQDLLAFVRNLKAELEINGSIAFTLKNGNVATVKEEWDPFLSLIWIHTLDFVENEYRN